MAEESLAPFLCESYGLDVALSPIDRWSADGPDLELWVRSLDGKSAFAPESAADGHRLWLELAFHEAAALFEAALTRLLAHLEAAFDELEVSMPRPQPSKEIRRVRRRSRATNATARWSSNSSSSRRTAPLVEPHSTRSERFVATPEACSKGLRRAAVLPGSASLSDDWSIDPG